MKLSVFLPPWGADALPDNFDRFASLIDELPFDTLWIGDHIVLPRAVQSKYPYNPEQRSPFNPDEPHFEPLSLIAYLAARTKRVNLGISVFVLPMRNPVEAAKSLANIDCLSRGRLTVGVGAGWFKEEFAALGANFDERGPRTDEWIAILRHLWSGQNDPFDGHYHQVPAVGMVPTPHRLPIVIGGNTRAAKQRAASIGDGWHALRLDPDDLASQGAALRRDVERAGRDPRRFTLVTRDWLVPPAVAVDGPAAAGKRAAQATAQRIDRFRNAGIDEFIVELPGMNTEQRMTWLDWIGGRIAAAPRS